MAPAPAPARPRRTAFGPLADFRHELRLFLDAGEAFAREDDLEPQHYHLLLAVKSHGDDRRITIKDLSGDLVLRHHSVVELVDRLEARGLVRRDRQPADRRRVHVTLTARGERTVAALAERHAAMLRASGPRLATALRRVLRAVGP